MRYAFVLVVSLVAGGAVYFITLRIGEQKQLAGLGFAPDTHARRRSDEDGDPALVATDPEAIETGQTLMAGAGEPMTDEGVAAGPTRAGAGYTYLRVETSGPSGRERVQGFVGLIVVIAVSAAVLALAVYQLGHVIDQTIQHFVK